MNKNGNYDSSNYYALTRNNNCFVGGLIWPRKCFNSILVKLIWPKNVQRPFLHSTHRLLLYYITLSYINTYIGSCNYFLWLLLFIYFKFRPASTPCATLCIYQGKIKFLLAYLLTYFLTGVLTCHLFLLQLNASDDRGIGIVRGAILSFASTRTIFKYVAAFLFLFS